MIKGPLVYAAVAFAAILMVLSFMIVMFPDNIATLGLVAGIVSVCVVLVLVLILVKTRSSV